MRIARDARKPIVIHTRSAWDDTMALLREHWAPSGLGGIIHCFSEGPREAEQALAIGFHISFAGIVTFPKATAIQEAARITPSDRLLIETDAPFLRPSPNAASATNPRMSSRPRASWRNCAASRRTRSRRPQRTIGGVWRLD